MQLSKGTIESILFEHIMLRTRLDEKQVVDMMFNRIITGFIYSGIVDIEQHLTRTLHFPYYRGGE